MSVEAPQDSNDENNEINSGTKKDDSTVLNIFSRGSCNRFLCAIDPIYDERNGQCCDRDSMGGTCVVGDNRWAGAYGVQADFVAMSHCSVEFISAEEINVCIL